MQRKDSSKKVDAKPYQTMLGSLSFLRVTRVDCVHALHQLARYASAPTQYSYHCLYNLFGYISGTREFTRKFYHSRNESKKSKLVALIDAAFANGPQMKSTSGHFIYYERSLLSVRSVTQKRTATSAPEAELFEMVDVAKTLLYLRGLLTDIGEGEMETTILTDSLSSVRTSHNPTSMRYRYLLVYLSFLRQLVKDKVLRVLFLKRIQNFADLVTKQATLKEFLSLSKLAFGPFHWQHKVEDKPVVLKKARSETMK